jgi:hypothetical protein
VFVVAGSEPTPGGNEAHYLAKARHYWDPQFGEGDFFLGSADVHLVFYWLAGWLTTIVPLGTAAWIGRLGTWAALAWSWVRLCGAMRMTGGRAVLAAALWWAGVEAFDLAGEWVIGGFESKPLAWVLVLLALEAIVAGRWTRVPLFVGAATAVHVLIGGWSALFSGVVLAAERHRPSLGRMAPSLGVGVAFASVGIVPAILLNLATPAGMVDRANQIYVFERLPHHLAPTLLAGGEQMLRYTRHGVLVALFGLLCMLVPADQAQRRLRLWIWSAFAAAAFGLAISALAPAAPSFAARALRFYWFRVNDVALPLGVACAAMSALAVMQINNPTSARYLMRSLTFAAALSFAVHLSNRVRDPRPAADRELDSYEAWVEMCSWVAANVPAGGRVITPPQSQTFTWRTGLAQVVTGKDVPQDASAIVEWRERMRRVEGAYAERGGDEFLSVGTRYGAQYAVAPSWTALTLPLVYENGVYALYKLR